MLIDDRGRQTQKEYRTELVNCIPVLATTVKNGSWKNFVFCFLVVEGKAQPLGSAALKTAFIKMKET